MFKIVTSLPTTYLQQNLVSDLPDLADWTDPDLLNPWGLTVDADGSFWIADNGAGVSTVYDSNGMPLQPAVPIPPVAGGTIAAAATGVVFNTTSSFVVGPNLPAQLIYATEDGTIVGRHNDAGVVFNIDLSGSGAVYKGIALGASDGDDYLYAANFSAGVVAVFDADYFPAFLAGSFFDPNLPAGYAPFNIQNIAGQLYVTYALQDAAARDAVPGPGSGYVNVFDTNGQLLRRLVSEGPLDAPWGIALAPGGFGGYGGALLIANFGDGLVNAFNPVTGELLGTLQDASGTDIAIEGLRGLVFGSGNDGRVGNSRTLYFTAGTANGGTIGDHGLFGSIVPTAPDPPEPAE
jgi:uncharacterized protein (TIGR03118 family)